jgi:hypothetical protein
MVCRHLRISAEAAGTSHESGLAGEADIEHGKILCARMRWYCFEMTMKITSTALSIRL